MAFEFLSNNTNVEFSATYIKGDERAVTVIQTDHQNGSDHTTGAANILEKEGGVAITNDHSHPGNEISNFTPSGFDPRNDKPLPTLQGDRAAAKGFESLYPSVIQRIYVPMTKDYIRYNSKKVFE